MHKNSKLKKLHFERCLASLFSLFILISLQHIHANFNEPFKNLIGSKEVTKIACIGTSVTSGSYVDNPINNAYPAQLSAMLGHNFLVKNYGVSDATLLKKGDHPYYKTSDFKDAKAFYADVVFIELGANDSKLQNRVHLEDFQEDYIDLISSIKENNENVRIVLLQPLPSFAEDTLQIWNPIIFERIIPSIQKIAYSTRSEVIDLYQLFIDQNNLFPDKIHPSSLGATVIARRMYELLTLKADSNYDISVQVPSQNFIESNFHGYKQLDFSFNGIGCKIVQPKKVNKNHNWIWRARFWGHESQTDIALLERGFHIVYCDVANLFGSMEAIKRWDAYYQLMTQNGLSEKVVLEGMSRGGLIIYNWASENPEKIAAVYADAPVLDGTSWPGGLGIGKGSVAEWEAFKIVYQLGSDREVENFKEDPIHKTGTIAKAGFPMLHVCGENDSIVPVAENTIPFENQIRKKGGEIKVIYKKNIGHHPHSLKNPTPIVNFILNATGTKINFATISSPGSEYRSGAGWPEGKGWWSQKNDIDSICSASEKIDLLLLGNSITQGWGGLRKFVTYAPGQKSAGLYFKDIDWVNAGISGDRTEHISFRLKNGNFEMCDPKIVVLTIGVNNFPHNSAEEISKGIKLNIQIIEDSLPNSKIVLLGPLPTGLKKDSMRREKYEKIHQLIGGLDDKESVDYYNLIDLFLDKNENLDLELYSTDGVHLKPEGYLVWGDFIKNKVLISKNSKN